LKRNSKQTLIFSGGLVVAAGVATILRNTPDYVLGPALILTLLLIAYFSVNEQK